VKLSDEVRFALRQGAIYAAGGNALVTIDPGSVSTGWCVRILRPAIEINRMPEEPPIFEHGQSPGPAAAAHDVLSVCGIVPIGFLAVEQPVEVSKGNQWKLAWAAGEIRGRLAEQQVDERCTWTPGQSTWRAVRGFSKGRVAARARGVELEPINNIIHAWAEAHVAHPLRDGEKPEYDRANAIALCDAAVELMKEEAKKNVGTQRV
jgi:hypothetical protein